MLILSKQHCLVGHHEATRLQLKDTDDFSQARFMESWESKHSDQSFSSKLAKELGVTAAPLRLDSQAKYGTHMNMCTKASFTQKRCT